MFNPMKPKEYLLLFVLINLLSCIGINKSKKDVSKIIIQNGMNQLLQSAEAPTFSSIPNPAGGQIIDPDPERNDPRYLLSDEEINFITEYEEKLNDLGTLSDENLAKFQSDLSETISFEIPTQDDLEMYVDEMELGIPHRKRIPSESELKKKEVELHAKIESFYIRAGSEIPKYSDENLKTVLLNLSANIRLNQILSERVSMDGISNTSFQKNLELIIYLRRRVIGEMIERGIR